MSHWKETILTEITEKIGDGLHGTPKYDDSGDYFFINGNNLTEGKIVIKQETKKVSKAEFEKYQKPLSEKTILLGINGTIGNLAFYNGEKCVLGKSACYINVNEKVNKHFLYYNFLSRDFQNFLEGIATGTTIPNVPLKGLREYSFKLPPLPEQTAIAEVLSSLDDKIDLLHRQNKTLEQLAETLFRQWFVEEAEESWEVGTIGEVITIYDSKRIPVSSGEREKMKVGKLYPYYGAATIMDYVNDYIFDGEYILMGEDGTVQTPDGFPILQLPTGKFWVNNHAHIFQAKSPFTNFFIYIFLKQTNISGIVTGAVQPKINQEALKRIDFPIPPIEKTKEFITVTDEFWNKIKSNTQQIRTLTQLRDTLLPKLMSGEVKVNINGKKA